MNVKIFLSIFDVLRKFSEISHKIPPTLLKNINL